MREQEMLEASQYWRDAKSISARAAAEGRELTPEEQMQFATLLSKQAEARGAKALATDPSAQPWAFGGDPGRAFVESAGYKSIRDPANRPQQWTTGAIP